MDENPRWERRAVVQWPSDISSIARPWALSSWSGWAAGGALGGS